MSILVNLEDMIFFFLSLKSVCVLSLSLEWPQLGVTA